jgi:tetratricopeptide (TPR) repeat protein
MRSETCRPASQRAGADDRPDAVHVSAIIDEYASESAASVSEDDYRSHYDLGMAYLEMDLLPEAIREYQFAAKSPQYQNRSIEMIGLCFLKQNQANLAIKQLTKGLDLIKGDLRDAIGIKYNLGLAYEMAGDFEKAKNAFEDVYVDDVTFRDVAEKLAKYS